jgi:hypothetical protein
MNSEKIRELALKLGSIGDHLWLNDAEEIKAVEKFAELIIENMESDAINLIKFIANDYCELSYEKIIWQRDDYIKRCKQFLGE